MDAKKLLFLTVFVLLLGGATYCFAGDTTITGTMSCVMPEMVEIQPTPATINAQALPPKEQEPASPIVSGASGNYEVQKEEKLIQTEKTEGNRVTVYTVCAK
jgi:hypothetical protein